MNKRVSKLQTFDWRTVAKPIAVMLATMTLCLPSSGQTLDPQQLNGLHLSRAMREQLIQRFALFVEYEKTQSYAKQFDLVSEKQLAALRNMKVERGNYVIFKQESERAVGELVELRVTHIKRIFGKRDQLSISVIAELHKGERTYSDMPICEAYLENGRWRFWLEYVN